MPQGFLILLGHIRAVVNARRPIDGLLVVQEISHAESRKRKYMVLPANCIDPVATVDINYVSKAAIGTPKTVKAVNQRPPRRRKKFPGVSSPHEYNGPFLREEYSFTCYKARITSMAEPEK